MNIFDSIIDSKGNEYLAFNKSTVYNDNKVGCSLNDFEILMVLGKGSFSTVFKVRSKINNKIYAMKRIKIAEIVESKDGERLLERTKGEIFFLNQLNQLSNPHIIKYYNNFIKDGFLYIIIEYLNNGDMQELIEVRKEKKQYFEEEELLNIFLQCMMALVYIHKKKFIHRDIKPKNIFIDNYMKIKLGDFGLTCIFEKNEDKNGKVDEKYLCHQTIIGTHNYMSHEMLSKKEYDYKTDVSSMGTTFFEMMYFHSPLIDSDEDKKKEYSEGLIKIVQSMLKDKNERPTSEDIYKEIAKEYYKSSKNTSINSVLTCLSSFELLNNELMKADKEDKEDKENKEDKEDKKDKKDKEGIEDLETIEAKIITTYIDYISHIKQNQENQDENLNNFRTILGISNLKLEGTKEIDPIFVYAFIIEKIHQGLNKIEKSSEPNYEKGPHLLMTEQTMDESEIRSEYINYYEMNLKSPISKNLCGLMKVRNKCKVCNMDRCTFNYFFLVFCDLYKIVDEKNKILNLEEFLKNENYFAKKNNIFCGNCLNKTQHDIYKKIDIFPNSLVISIQRGNKYECKAKIDIKDILEINSEKKYKLVSLLKRIVKDDKEYFVSNYCNNGQWFSTEKGEKDIKDIKIKPPYECEKENNDGDIIMLFYEIINLIN